MTRRRRWPVVLAVVVVVLAGLALGADRAAASVGAAKLAARLHKVDKLRTAPTEPSVKLHGFPLLTQAMRGRYDHIELTAHDVEWREGLRVRTLTAQLFDVSAPASKLLSGSLDEVRVGRASGQALISYQALNAYPQARGIKVSYGGAGRVSVTGQIPIAGQPLTLSGLAGLSMSGDNLDIAIAKVTAADGSELPPAVRRLLREAVHYEIPLGSLPMGLRITQVAAGADGITVSGASGSLLVNVRSGSVTPAQAG